MREIAAQTLTSCHNAHDAIRMLTEALLDLGAPLDAAAHEPGLSPRQTVLENRLRAVRSYLIQKS